MKTAQLIELVSQDDLDVAFDMVQEYEVDATRDDVNDTFRIYFEDGSDVLFTQVYSNGVNAKFLEFNY